MSGYMLHIIILYQMLGIGITFASNEYCIVVDDFNPTCAEDEIIIMQEAKYGQMEIGKCIKEDLGFLGCYGDVLDIFDNLCSGKQTCDVRVGSNGMGETSTCRDGILQYLEATYICRKALQIAQHQCSTQSPIPLTEKETLITSDITERGLQSCIRLNHPFTVSAEPGHLLNITLIDFHHVIEHDRMSQTYGRIRDVADGNEIAITGRQRVHHLMVTHGNQIDITMYTNANRFALDIDGCADLSPPVGAWMTRDGDVTELGCNSGKHTWTLRCIDDKWIGAVGYCGTGVGEQSYVEPEVTQVKRGISANIIAFGICSLLLLISSIIFLIGVLILRRHNKSMRSQYNYHPAVPVAVPCGKDLIMFESGSMRQPSLHGSMIGTLPADSGRMTTSQDYKSLQI